MSSIRRRLTRAVNLGVLAAIVIWLYSTLVAGLDLPFTTYALLGLTAYVLLQVIGQAIASKIEERSDRWTFPFIFWLEMNSAGANSAKSDMPSKSRIDCSEELGY